MPYKEWSSIGSKKSERDPTKGTMRKNQRQKDKHNVRDAPGGKVQGDRFYQQSGKIFSSYQIAAG